MEWLRKLQYALMSGMNALIAFSAALVHYGSRALWAMINLISQAIKVANLKAEALVNSLVVKMRRVNSKIWVSILLSLKSAGVVVKGGAKLGRFILSHLVKIGKKTINAPISIAKICYKGLLLIDHQLWRVMLACGKGVYGLFANIANGVRLIKKIIHAISGKILSSIVGVSKIAINIPKKVGKAFWNIVLFLRYIIVKPVNAVMQVVFNGYNFLKYLAECVGLFFARVFKSTKRAVNLVARKVLWVASLPLIATKYLCFVVLEVVNKIVQFFLHAWYGFVWIVSMPLHSTLFCGRVLALSYAHLSDRTQNIVHKIRAFIARIAGVIKTIFSNIKQHMLSVNDLSGMVRQMWSVSHTRVDNCVKEAEEIFKPENGQQGEGLQDEGAYGRWKLIIRRIWLKIYARMHMRYLAISYQFNTWVHNLAYEFKSVMEASEKDAEQVHSPVYRAINSKPRRAIMIMFFSIGGLFIAFIVWASLVEIKGYVNATGRIETYDQLQTITAFDGAVVAKILVEEDQAVHKGQELIRFDNTVYKARYHDLQEKYYTKMGNISALEARITGTPLDLDEEIRLFSPRIYSEAEASYKAGLNVNDTNLNVLDTQISHKEKEISDAHKDRELYLQHIDLIKSQVEILSKLAANELVSKLRLIEAQKEMISAQMKLKDIEAELMRDEGDMKGLQDRKANYISNFHKDMLNELASNRNDLSGIIADMTAAKDQLTRTVITSPIDGSIYKISTKAVPGHTISGQEVISIVPTSGRLVLTGLVRPSEIGFVKKGQKVNIKVATYDYSLYGTLPGVVERISPETIQNKVDGVYYYEVVVKSEYNYLEYKGRKFYIKPGMDATANFELDSKTVLHYMFDPFIKSLQSSLSER